MRRAFRNPRATGIVWLLLVAALFMRAVVPAGYMARAEGGEIVVDICNSDRTFSIPVPAKEKSAKDHEKPAPCTFAGMAAPALTAHDIVVPIASTVAVEPRPARSAQAATRAPPRLTPPATGPPVSV